MPLSSYYCAKLVMLVVVVVVAVVVILGYHVNNCVQIYGYGIPPFLFLFFVSYIVLVSTQDCL